MTSMEAFIKKLTKLHACQPAKEWCKTQPDLLTAWMNCERGDYMLWYAGICSGSPKSPSRKKLVLATCECARLALTYIAKGEDRPLLAIETAEKWARGEGGITLSDVRAAAYAAAASFAASAAYAAFAAFAASADAASAAAYAADASANAAYAAYAADAASAAAYAAAAASAAYAAAYAAERKGILSQCADIVRKHYPGPPEIGKEAKCKSFGFVG